MQRAVFLDRDGVICQNRSDYVKSWDEFAFLPSGLESLARLARTDLLVVIVTNQSSINRGILSPQVVNDIHLRMRDAVTRAGGRVDGVFYCPHRPDEHCECRKPKPGLLLQAADELNIDLSSSYMVGDADSDMRAGQAVGCDCLFVLTGRGQQQLAKLEQRGSNGVIVIPNLASAVDAIIQRERQHKNGIKVKF